jgi:hypothetical protein
MATIRTIVRQYREPGKLMVYAQYGHNCKTCLVFSGIVIHNSEWDAVNKRLNTNKYDNILEEIKTDIINVANKLLSQGINPNVKLVKQKFIKRSLSVTDLQKQLAFHMEEVEKLRALIKAAKHKERFDNGGSEKIKESIGYAKRTVEKMCKIKTSDFSLIHAQKQNLQVKRKLNMLNLKIKGI